jgi:hypothetical protein
MSWFAGLQLAGFEVIPEVQKCYRLRFQSAVALHTHFSVLLWVHP